MEKQESAEDARAEHPGVTHEAQGEHTGGDSKRGDQYSCEVDGFLGDVRAPLDSSFDDQGLVGSFVCMNSQRAAEDSDGNPRHRDGKLRPCRENLLVASWNVEGLTHEKLTTLQMYMNDLSIGLLAMQKTHKLGSAYFETEAGVLVMLSGSLSNDETAGVGFIIAP